VQTLHLAAVAAPGTARSNPLQTQQIGVRDVTGFKSSGAFGDICVALWDSVGYVAVAKPVPGGGAPPTPPPGID